MVLVVVIFSGEGITHDVPQIRGYADQEAVAESYSRR